MGNGVPKGNDGFRVLSVEPADNDFAIQGGDGTAEGAGRCLVEGWDVLNEQTLNYIAQPLFNNADLATKWGVDPVPPLTTPTTDRTDAVYLDIWEREVNAAEDNELVNPAIGIETCVRHKREWVVRVAEGASPPPQILGHVHYPLASLSRKASEPVRRYRACTSLRIFRPRIGGSKVMRLVIAHDQKGQIVTVAKVYRLPEDTPHPFADLLEEHRILSIEEPKGELREIRLVEIQQQFNVVKGELVRKKQKS